MKKLIALTLVTLGISVSARAQWVVYDPANTIQSVINTAQEIAKYVEMIQNQLQQIQALEDQLNEFKHYEESRRGQKLGEIDQLAHRSHRGRRVPFNPHTPSKGIHDGGRSAGGYHRRD